MGGVLTTSEGEGVFRRVCIIPKNEAEVGPEVPVDEGSDEPSES
jgi:hypothetical protein